MPSTYPTVNEIRSYLESVGLEIPSTYDLDSVQAAAVAEWERRTGWRPFVATGTASEKTFNPPKYWTLDLCNACQSIESITIDGEEWTETTDWYTETELTPGYIDHIVFRRSPGNLPNSIVIDADWGRVPDGDVPQEVWNAIRMLAAIQFIQDVDLSLRGFDKIEQGPVKLTRGATDEQGSSGTVRSLVAQSDRVVSAYQRRTLWD